MKNFLIRRFISLIIGLLLGSFFIFIIIELPPGDYAERYASKLNANGYPVTDSDMQSIRKRFGLDQPFQIRYFKWIGQIITKGDFGVSFTYQEPVLSIIKDRIFYTIILAVTTLVVTYGMAISVGILSAIYQYSIADYLATILGYIGLAIPSFLLALILMYINVKVFNMNVGGLFSPEFTDAPWTLARVIDMLKHLWVPALVIGMSSTAFQIRTIRATMLDEKNKLYVKAARAKGLNESKVILKYPVREAINPVISTLGWELATIISGAPIVSIVLALPDTGPLLLNALLDQDMYLAGAMLLILTTLTIIGTFISDLLLIAIDPRVRIESSVNA